MNSFNMYNSLLSSRAQLLPEEERLKLPLSGSSRQIVIMLALTGTFLVLVFVSVGLYIALKPGPLYVYFGPAVPMKNVIFDTNRSMNANSGLTGRNHGSIAELLGLISHRATNETGSQRLYYFEQGDGTGDAEGSA